MLPYTHKMYFQTGTKTVMHGTAQVDLALHSVAKQSTCSMDTHWTVTKACIGRERGCNSAEHLAIHCCIAGGCATHPLTGGEWYCKYTTQF